MLLHPEKNCVKAHFTVFTTQHEFSKRRNRDLICGKQRAVKQSQTQKNHLNTKYFTKKNCGIKRKEFYTEISLKEDYSNRDKGI